MTRGGDRLMLLGILVVLGAGWGLTQPLAKLAVSDGYRHFGLVFWQMAIGAVLLMGVTAWRGRSLPFGPPYLRLYALLAIIGTIIPNSASYQAAVYLPSGILSVVLSLVPIIAFPIALGLGIDQFRWQRLGGLLLGFTGILLLAWPGTKLADTVPLVFLPLALVAPCLYALEGNIVAKWGTLDLDPIQTLAGVSVIGAIISAPLALVSGQWIAPPSTWSLPDYAVVLSAIIHALVYSGYVWLVQRAGSVFAVQVSYLVTGFGVIWAMILLDETYTGNFWLALMCMFVGLLLVTPKVKPPLSPHDASPKVIR